MARGAEGRLVLYKIRFNAYVVRKGQAFSDYACDPMGWRRKCLVNIAKAGMFSSDRTIAEYDRDIWHLGK